MSIFFGAKLEVPEACAAMQSVLEEWEADKASNAEANSSGEVSATAEAPAQAAGGAAGFRLPTGAQRR